VPRRVTVIDRASRRPWPQPWRQPPLLAPTLVAPETFELLGERATLSDAASWNDPVRSKLWLYNLHYLDDLNAREFAQRAAAHVALVERWIADNPPGRGVGWEPYPLSLRIVNLVKWLDRQQTIAPHWLSSLATQAGALAQRLEFHLLGNHLFANAKALVFAGAFLDGPRADRWLQRGLALLDREIPEQFLPDGGHFERSPMYQATLAADLCDLTQLADVSGLPALRARRPGWAAVLARALRWLDAMTHPDGEIAFFNDAAIGIAPRPADLHGYAASLSVTGVEAPLHPFGLRRLDASGYYRVDLPAAGAAIIDVAPLGPDYLPAHGHADTLAFELSLFGARVFVNSGTSLYGDDAERLRQRGTAAHNAVVVDGADSSEVWGSFRVARRARATLYEAAERDGRIVVDATHDGYRRLPGRNVHRRRFTFEPSALRIDDAIDGPFRSAVGHLHLHPAVAIETIDPIARAARLRLPGGHPLQLEVTGAALAARAATWHPRFGACVPTQVLEYLFERPAVAIALCWSAPR
jgi:uncharacterized heparinase superfamily protein